MVLRAEPQLCAQSRLTALIFLPGHTFAGNTQNKLTIRVDENVVFQVNKETPAQQMLANPRSFRYRRHDRIPSCAIRSPFKTTFPTVAPSRSQSHVHILH